jgi:hypothetical protein
MYYLNSSSLGATMRFDLAEAKIRGSRIYVDRVQMIKNGIFSGVVADADWNALEGGNEVGKLKRLLSLADSRVDYLIVPDEATIEHLEQNIAFNIINRYQRQLSHHIANSGNWIPVGSPIVNGQHETVQLYRNVWRTRNLAWGRSGDQQARVLR